MLTENPSQHTNELIHESSPYLLQHAHNPVNWLAWNESALKKAVDENKLLLISIGYSSCHWCHVMEHECFEDEETAAIMNKYFICVKVDREERPDVDAIYMSAVQLITGRGGWPLNCITLPDQRPIYGGTYFPKQQWQQVLVQVATLFEKEPDQCIQYASDLTQGVKKMELVQKSVDSFDEIAINAIDFVKNLAAHFDKENGGMNRAPKFPMPANWELLLQLYYHTGKNECLNQVDLTLTKMAYGGIYDQLAGGFARYSTDNFWKVPHFEKMLYDNAQLVSLYSNAFLVTGNALYKSVVYETLEFISHEMTSSEGGFYSALDADSEGMEGKYYIWKKAEIENILVEHAVVFCDYYNVNELGYLEDDYYILLRDKENKEISSNHNITEKQLHIIIAECKKLLNEERFKRIRPGLDDKQICSWNALMLKGYTDAYVAFNEEHFLKTALKNATLLFEKFSLGDHLFRIYKEGNAKINGYLEDYALVIEAFIALYQCTGNLQWLSKSRSLTTIVLDEFYDVESGMFYFTSKKDNPLIARKMEIQDNVISSANSTMAKNLIRLSHYYSLPEFSAIAKQMIANISEDITKNTPWYSNWAQAALLLKNTIYEVVIFGNEATLFYKEFSKHFLPNVLFAFSTEENSLPVFENRFVKGETLIYICRDNSCLAPVKSVGEALKLLKSEN